MKSLFRTRKSRIIAAVIGLPVVAAFAFGIYLASLSGDLPWQADPTRISTSLTPFAGIEGFSAPTSAPATVASPTSLATSTPSS